MGVTTAGNSIIVSRNKGFDESAYINSIVLFFVPNRIDESAQTAAIILYCTENCIK